MAETLLRSFSCLAAVAMLATGCSTLQLASPAPEPQPPAAAPPRNGTAVLRQKVGTTRLQADGEAGNLALLCNVVVQKNRITSVTVSVVSRQPRCQCGRSSAGSDAPPGRTCIA